MLTLSNAPINKIIGRRIGIPYRKVYGIITKCNIVSSDKRIELTIINPYNPTQSPSIVKLSICQFFKQIIIY